jgi:hypothetical protein
MDGPPTLDFFHRLAIIGATLTCIAVWLGLLGLYLPAAIAGAVAGLFVWFAYLCRPGDRNA